MVLIDVGLEWAEEDGVEGKAGGGGKRREGSEMHMDLGEVNGELGGDTMYCLR